jgi:hypothetical protein
MYGGRKVVYMVLVRKSEVKRPFGEPRRRREDGSSGRGMAGRDWIEMAQDRDR